MEQTTGSRKCPACGQWSAWQQHPDDTCKFCNAILDPAGLLAQQQQQTEIERQKKQLNITLIEIYPEDLPFTKFWKRIVQGFQITLIGVVSFIIWVVTVVAG
ncbi:MAG: hypothetical protein EOP53_27570 [Sphingobacteriales bacterium]|nr:MAG: hypothetical protein EOP53_27570 [Sphingobacteriales bacterium]